MITNFRNSCGSIQCVIIFLARARDPSSLWIAALRCAGYPYWHIRNVETIAEKTIQLDTDTPDRARRIRGQARDERTDITAA